MLARQCLCAVARDGMSLTCVFCGYALATAPGAHRYYTVDVPRWFPFSSVRICRSFATVSFFGCCTQTLSANVCRPLFYFGPSLVPCRCSRMTWVVGRREEAVLCSAFFGPPVCLYIYVCASVTPLWISFLRFIFFILCFNRVVYPAPLRGSAEQHGSFTRSRRIRHAVAVHLPSLPLCFFVSLGRLSFFFNTKMHITTCSSFFVRVCVFEHAAIVFLVPIFRLAISCARERYLFLFSFRGL